MKVGILSMQRICNYGSLLQAYALKKILESLGHEISFVDILSKDSTASPERGNPNIVIKLLKKRNYIDRYFFKRLVNSRKNLMLNRLFMELQKKYLSLSDGKMGAEGLDAVVIGSDEIFNCDTNSIWGITGQRFGDIPEVKITISYAASCGYTDPESYSTEEEKIIQSALLKLKAISVRDRNTKLLVEKLIDRSAEINLDPVLIYDFTKELERTESAPIPSERYMIVYAYHNRINSPEEIREIKKYAHQNGLRLFAIGGSQPWCDKFIIPDPFQVLKYFKNADCIVTDTFHGTVISAKFNKKVAVLIRDSNRNKLGDLVKRLKLEQALVNVPADISKILCQCPDYKACNQIIDEGKKRALDYLRKNLSDDISS